jgi:putative DNA modification/repair radical SAM protein
MDEKVRLLSSGSRYDICQSSYCGGSGKDGGSLGAAAGLGICKTATPDGRQVCILKTLYTNKCVHDCRYCGSSVKGERAQFTPEELSKLFIGLYLENRVEGLFLSSGVSGDADSTAEGMCEAVRLIREKYGFAGYVHLKVLPGTSREYIKRSAELANRLSINVEAPSAGHLSEIAPNKDMENDIIRKQDIISEFDRKGILSAGQSTQLIVGAGSETDRDMLGMMDRQYREHRLKRVYFSAFSPCKGTPMESHAPAPLYREHRLYQMDWLMRVYKIKLNDLHTVLNDDGNLPNEDPKTILARSKLDGPVDLNSAGYRELLLVPGIGPQSAGRILALRRAKKNVGSFKQARDTGVVLKRAAPYIKVNGWTQSRLI